jgi:hypothetical protein
MEVSSEFHTLAAIAFEAKPQIPLWYKADGPEDKFRSYGENNLFSFWHWNSGFFKAVV